MIIKINVGILGSLEVNDWICFDNFEFLNINEIKVSILT